MDGMPKVHPSGPSFGAPNIVFPMTAPGPIPKNSHAIVTTHATGTSLFLFAGRDACSRRKLCYVIRCVLPESVWVRAETTIHTARLNIIPHPAEWMAHGHRPHGRSMPKLPAIAIPNCSVKITASNPATSPQLAPCRVIHGIQQTAARDGHI